jgi:hypothetical protein
MTSGRAVILNPATPASMKRRESLLDSLRKSGLDWAEDIEETRIVITWEGAPKPVRPSPVCRRPALPPPVTLEKALKSRFNCDPDDIEYWDELIALAAAREGIAVQRIQVRTTWQSEQWAGAWAVIVSEYLAVNRSNGYWTVTHVRTGLAAGSASTLKDAARVARDVSHWPEWAILQGKADVTPDFARKAREAFQAVAA